MNILSIYPFYILVGMAEASWGEITRPSKVAKCRCWGLGKLFNDYLGLLKLIDYCEPLWTFEAKVEVVWERCLMVNLDNITWYLWHLRSEMTLNHWMIMERYPKLNGVVGGLISRCKFFFVLDEKTSHVAMCLMCSKKKKLIMTFKVLMVLWFKVKNKTKRFVKESDTKDFNKRDSHDQNMIATCEKGGNHHWELCHAITLGIWQQMWCHFCN